MQSPFGRLASTSNAIMHGGSVVLGLGLCDRRMRSSTAASSAATAVDLDLANVAEALGSGEHGKG